MKTASNQGLVWLMEIFLCSCSWPRATGIKWYLVVELRHRIRTYWYLPLVTLRARWMSHRLAQNICLLVPLARNILHHITLPRPEIRIRSHQIPSAFKWTRLHTALHTMLAHRNPVRIIAAQPPGAVQAAFESLRTTSLLFFGPLLVKNQLVFKLFLALFIHHTIHWHQTLRRHWHTHAHDLPTTATRILNPAPLGSSPITRLSILLLHQVSFFAKSAKNDNFLWKCLLYWYFYMFGLV